jgi:hypothetical protein
VAGEPRQVVPPAVFDEGQDVDELADSSHRHLSPRM